MFKLALKNLWEHKVRLLASAVAVFLGVAFLAGTFVFTDSLRSVFDDLFSSNYRGTDVLVQGEQAFKADDPTAPNRSRLTAAQLAQVQTIPGVAAATGDVQGFAQVIDKSVIYSDAEAAKYIWGTGFHWYGEDHFDHVQLVHW